jgi:spermidine synthase
VRRVAELQGPAINTDDRTPVEFGFARSLTDAGNLHASDIEALARARGEDRPVGESGDIDWTLVEDEKSAFALSLGMAPAAGRDEAERTRFAALAEWLANRYASIPALWRRQTGEPRALVEKMVLGDGLAELGDEGAMALVETLRPLWPPVAAGIEARLRLRQGRAEDAMRAFETSLLAYGTDPWPPPTFMLRTMNLAVEASRGNVARMHRVFARLSNPFAVHMMDEARAMALVTLAKALPAGPACIHALGYFEPEVPWNGDFLSFRAQCYRATGHPRARVAQQDLDDFLAHAQAKFPAALAK